MSRDTSQPLIKRLLLHDVMSEDERAAVESLPMRIRTFSRGEELVQAYSRPSESCLLLTGFAARAVYLENGTRQITAVHLSGDFVDLHALLLKVMDHSVLALSACSAAFVPHAQLRDVCAQLPHLARLFWLSTVIDAAIHRAWLTCIGRRSPAKHIGHLLCEIYVRLNAVGLASEDAFDFPVTQSELADMIGLSLVHVNKTVQTLRTAGMFSWDGGRVVINDFERLAGFSGFDRTYLSLHSEPR